MKIVRMPFSRTVLMSTQGIPTHLLTETFLLMPPDSKLVGCGTDTMYFLDYMFFSSDAFKDIPEASAIPDIIPTFKMNSDGTPYVEKIDFGNVLASGESCYHVWEVVPGFTNSYECCRNCGAKK
jgi:hypothetical protein